MPPKRTNESNESTEETHEVIEAAAGELLLIEAEPAFALRELAPLVGLAETAPLDEIRASLASLKAQAALGTRYRADLIEETLKEGVRAHGASFDQARYKTVLEALPDIDSIRLMRDDWAAIASQRLPGGRATTNGETTERESLEARLARPLHAYRD